MLEIIGLVGITIIITSGNILASVRNKFKRWEKVYKFITCPLCIGFWIGALFSLMINPSIKEFFIYGGAVSIISYVVDTILMKIEIDIQLSTGLPPKRDKHSSDGGTLSE